MSVLRWMSSRTPSGKPDFSGIWQAMTKAHYDIEPHAAAYGPHPGQMGALSPLRAVGHR